jgi:hypothetical protein
MAMKGSVLGLVGHIGKLVVRVGAEGLMRHGMNSQSEGIDVGFI